MPAGVFSLIQGGNREVGQALVQHPLIKAVGFTGSLPGAGRCSTCAPRGPSRSRSSASSARSTRCSCCPRRPRRAGEAIGSGWAGSLTMGAGQFCTNPGIAVIEAGPDGDAFVAAAKAALEKVGAGRPC